MVLAAFVIRSKTPPKVVLKVVLDDAPEADVFDDCPFDSCAAAAPVLTCGPGLNIETSNVSI